MKNFQLPHWIGTALAVIAAIAATLAQSPQFASYAPLLNGIATLLLGSGVTTLLHAPSINGATNVAAARRYEASIPIRTIERGFVRVRTLLTLAWTLVCVLGIALAACAGWKASAPERQTLAQCASGYVAANFGESFEAIVVGLAVSCGADVLDVLQTIVDSADPNLAQFKAQAAATKADYAKVADLRVKLLLRTRDGGP